MTVTFYDASPGSPTAWKWSFGDGSPLLNGYNPTHTYTKAGVYTVKETVSNAFDKDTAIKTGYITVYADEYQPSADFSASITSGNTPSTVTFYDASSGSPTAWKWSFGDGSPLLNGYNPTHTYTKAGVYTVKETVSNSVGKDTEIKTNYINVKAGSQKPVAAFTASPPSGKKPLTVKFTDKSKGLIISRSWNFGDKTTSKLQSSVHKYTKAGKYTVSLTVKNAAGSNTAKKTNYITVK
jgi:PKD repeat protein